MLIEWNSGLSVNIREIDEQHRKLVDMINNLNKAMRNGKGKEILGGLLVGLVNYVGVHFELEEKLMKAHSYPGLAAQEAEHRGFAAKVSEFKSQFENGKTMMSISIMTFLSDWLKNHIMKTDKLYGPFLNAKGVE